MNQSRAWHCEVLGTWAQNVFSSPLNRNPRGREPLACSGRRPLLLCLRRRPQTAHLPQQRRTCKASAHRLISPKHGSCWCSREKDYCKARLRREWLLQGVFTMQNVVLPKLKMNSSFVWDWQRDQTRIHGHTNYLIGLDRQRYKPQNQIFKSITALPTSGS
jgi:hypothetical protein